MDIPLSGCAERGEKEEATATGVHVAEESHRLLDGDGRELVEAEDLEAEERE